VLDEMGTEARRSSVTEAPRMVDLTGFAQFLQNLKNQGMHPYLMGDSQPTRPRRSRAVSNANPISSGNR